MHNIGNHEKIFNIKYIFASKLREKETMEKKTMNMISFYFTTHGSYPFFYTW